MSSLFPKRLTLLLCLATAPAAWAQQNYFIPSVELTGERHTNRELVTNSAVADESNSYKAVLEGRFGRATPRAVTELRPRVILQEFPDREGVDPIEFMVDLRHDYRTIKGRFSLTGRYAHQDTINAEYGDAVFDDDGDPNTPPLIDDDSGIIFVGQTRQTFDFAPSFEYGFSERMSFGGHLKYQAVRYDESPVSRRVGFDSPLVEVGLIYQAAPRTKLSFGPYVSRYEANEEDLEAGASLETDTYGARLGVVHEWSEVSNVGISLRGERNDTTTATTSGQTTNWGVEIVGERRNRLGRIQYGVGRFLSPSTLGNRRESDRIQFQYDRPFSEKLSLRGAVRLSRDQAIGLRSVDDDRNRIRAELGLVRLLTRTWYVGGGYRYAWDDIEFAGASQADNHTVFVSVGFQGQDPRRRGR